MPPTQPTQTAQSADQVQLDKYSPSSDSGENQHSSLRPPTETIDLISKAEGYLPGTTDRKQLPDVSGFDYHPSIEKRGSAETIEFWRVSGPSRLPIQDEEDPEKIPWSSGIFVDGVREYLEDYALKEISYPKYYTRFPDMEPIFRWSADSATHIDGRYLERCVRLANGKGRIDTDETHLVLCSPGTIVAAGPRGIFLVEIVGGTTSNLPELPAHPEKVHVDIGGITLPEEHPELRDGFERLYSHTKKHGPSAISSYNRLSEKGHRVKTEDGTEATISSTDLEKVQNHTHSKPDLVNESYKHYCNGEYHTATISSSDIPGNIGDWFAFEPKCPRPDTPPEKKGTIIGYETNWIEDEYVFSNSVNTLKLTISVLIITPDLEIARETIPVTELDL